jgi:CRISPR/Cas system CMR subunit Cmr4 (Cas7 group RAMP superfamily)
MRIENKHFLYYTIKYILNDLNQFLTEKDNSKKFSWLINALFHAYNIKLYKDTNKLIYFDRFNLCYIKLDDNVKEIIEVIKKYVDNENIEDDVKAIIDYFNDFLEKRKNRVYVLR